MKTIALSSILMTVVSSGYSQSGWPRQIVTGADTVICMTREQLRFTNLQLSLFKEYQQNCDSIIAKTDLLIHDYKQTVDNLDHVIANKDVGIEGKDKVISNLEAINTNNKKKGRKNIFYFTFQVLFIPIRVRRVPVASHAPLAACILPEPCA